MHGWSILGRRVAARSDLPLSRHAEIRLRERMIPVDEIRDTLASGRVRRRHRSASRAVFEGSRVEVVVAANGSIVTVAWKTARYAERRIS